MSELSQVCEFQNNLKFELLYRGSETNFSWTEFHAKCDDKSPTLLIVKSNDGCIFGGYTKAKWDTKQFWVADSEAYLFRLKTLNLESKKYRIEEHRGALFCLNSNGPWFGFDDLTFNDTGNLSTRLNSNIPDTDRKRRSIYGVPFKSQEFNVDTQITELEVYQEL